MYALSWQARGRLMSKLADVMEAHLTQLALLESLDSGKPLSQSMTKEIPLCIDNFRYFAGWVLEKAGWWWWHALLALGLREMVLGLQVCVHWLRAWHCCHRGATCAQTCLVPGLLVLLGERLLLSW